MTVDGELKSGQLAASVCGNQMPESLTDVANRVMLPDWVHSVQLQINLYNT